MIILITYDFFIQKNICMHLFIYLSSLYQDSCIMLNLLTMPPKNMQFELHFEWKTNINNNEGHVIDPYTHLFTHAYRHMDTSAERVI